MKEIKGFEGRYSITKDGQVYSHLSNRFLNKCVRKTGVKYPIISLTKNGITKGFCIHRLLAETFIPNPKKLTHVDHINMNPSDNRIENLRWSDASGNNTNKLKQKKTKGEWTSKYKGVSWDKTNKKWQVYISINGKPKRVGRIKDEIEAAKLFDEKAKQFYGEFVRTNF